MEVESGRPTFCEWISFTTVFHYLLLPVSFFCIVFSCVFRLPINLAMAGGGSGVSYSKKHSLYEKSVVSERVAISFFLLFLFAIRTINNV